MLGMNKKILTVLLRNIVNGSNHTKCVSLSNQKCITQPTHINLHPNECSQEFHYYIFAVKLNRGVGSCNTLNDLPNKVCVPYKAEDLTLSKFSMITWVDESKELTKHVSCECKCKFDGRQCNSNQWFNNKKCWYECKKRHICQKDYIWNPVTCNCENGINLASIMDDSVLTVIKL